jgi:Mechanosensitive ion channel
MSPQTVVYLINEGLVLFAVLCVELVLRYILRRRKAAFNKEKLGINNPRELEALALSYNKKNQILGVVRLSVILVAVFVSILVYDIQAFSFFLLAVGALIIALKESVSSMVAYFYILSAYDVGDDIKIGNSLGEIGRMSPLYTSIIGKEENGEYNGKLINIPNHLFFQQLVERQELKSTNYRRTQILWTFNREHSQVSFPEIVKKARIFLDDLLPVRNVDEIGFFRNYAGRRYRLALDYNEEGFPTIRIAFVAHPDDISSLREKIVAFLEEAQR